MKYGCIGEHLPHSFSKIIHAQLASNEYELCELTPDEVGEFLQKKEFLGVNVTIPYKQTVMPYLDEIDETALAIGAVNTIVNRAGRLYGYNTDFGGMRAMLSYHGIDLANKKVLVLGTGGTSRTARAVATAMGARTVITVSRTARNGAIDYAMAYSLHADAEVIINTTPCGMFPNAGQSPVELSRFSSLVAVVDVIYNPLRTDLVLQAQQRGIRACGGLYMLVAQAVLASELFTGVTYDGQTMDTIFHSIQSEKENLVLVGMPASGKSTVGEILARSMGRPLIDSDAYVVQKSGMTIPEIFAKYGEARFRTLEREAIEAISAECGVIIATGGGAVLDPHNVHALRRNGRIYFLDRPLEQLLPTSDRPTANTAEAIRKRYEERYEIYCHSCDEQIHTLATAELTAEEIKRRHGV